MSIRIMAITAVLVSMASAVMADESICSALLSDNTPSKEQKKQIPLVTLGNAIGNAFQNDLRRRRAYSEIEAERLNKAIASFGPPDQMEIETENFPGSGIADDIDRLEVTGSYARIWERGGKRQARENLAASGITLAEATAIKTEYQIAYEVRKTYIETLMASARKELACNQMKRLTSLKSVIEKRVKQSVDPLVAEVRFATELLSAQSRFHQLEIEEDSFKERLSSFIGITKDDFILDKRLLDEPVVIRPVDPSFSSTPYVVELEARQRKARARMEVERSNRVTDITWRIGVRSYGFSNDLGLVTGISIPLGMGARGDAGLARARAQESVIFTEKRAFLQQMRREVIALQRSIRSAGITLEALEGSLIPTAEQALELAEQGYLEGALSFRDVLDSYEALIALRREKLDQLEAYLLNDAALWRLSAKQPTGESPQ